MVRYYGYYSNVARGKRKKSDQDELIPSIFEPDGTSKEYRKNRARLIQKIYEVAPLTCPKCHGKIKILRFIKDGEIIKKDPQISGIVGSEGKAASKSQRQHPMRRQALVQHLSRPSRIREGDS